MTTEITSGIKHELSSGERTRSSVCSAVAEKLSVNELRVGRLFNKALRDGDIEVSQMTGSGPSTYKLRTDNVPPGRIEGKYRPFGERRLKDT